MSRKKVKEGETRFNSRGVQVLIYSLEYMGWWGLTVTAAGAALDATIMAGGTVAGLKQ